MPYGERRLRSQRFPGISVGHETDRTRFLRHAADRNLHLGNYLGAMLNWIRLQDTHECIYCVVDMHAITVRDPEELNRAIRDVTAAYIACGVDPKRSIIFNQSQVGEHAELAWIFNCVARLGWLERMTQFKEKAGKDKERASVGSMSTPI